MPVTSADHTPNCRWGFISGPGRARNRSLVWICEYPYRTIRNTPSDDCEGCRRALATMARGPHLDDEVRELERMMHG
jgi:hypothetical protein